MTGDVTHWRTILALGLGGVVVGVLLLTWVYPTFCERVCEVKEHKMREISKAAMGLSGHSLRLVRTGVTANHEKSVDGQGDAKTSVPSAPPGRSAHVEHAGPRPARAPTPLRERLDAHDGAE